MLIYVEFKIIYDLQDKNIQVTRKLTFPRRIIPLQQYEAFKTNLELVAKATEERIFLEKIGHSQQENTTPSTAPSDSLETGVSRTDYKKISGDLQPASATADKHRDSNRPSVKRGSK